MLFMLSANLTEEGVRNLKDAPKRAQASRELAKKIGVEIKQVYMTTGESDLVFFVEAPTGDNMLKFAMALGMRGHLRTKTARAWPMDDFMKLVAELP